MSRIPEIDRVLDQGVQIPKTSSTNWDIPVNDNWELLNTALKNKFDRISASPQTIEGEPTIVLSNFTFTEKIQGKITNADNADTATRVQEALTINGDPYDGSEAKTLELVKQSEVGNEAGKIPRYSDEGHLVLPNGVEIW